MMAISLCYDGRCQYLKKDNVTCGIEKKPCNIKRENYVGGHNVSCHYFSFVGCKQCSKEWTCNKT